MAVLDIQWQPKQWQLWKLVEESRVTNIGFGGSKGGGKSKGGRNLILSRAMKYPGTRHLIFRRTFEELWDNHITKLFEEFPITTGWYNAQHKEMVVPTGRGKQSSIIKFGYAEHKGDIYKFQGKDYLTQLRDEATHLTEEEHVFLDGCARYVGDLPVTPKVVYTMNPGSRGHAYIKRVFITKEYRENEDPKDWAFIQSYGWDNYGWFFKELQRDSITAKQFYSWSNDKRFKYYVTQTDYGRKQYAQPETERLQYLYGDWDVFAGQFFSEFRRDLHVIKPFRIPEWWERFSAGDWGYTSPACNLWFACTPDDWCQIEQSDGRVVIIPPRSVITYRESWVTKKTTPQLAELWAKLNGSDKLRYRLMDPAFGPTRGGGVSVQEEFNSNGWPVVDADNDRLNGWARVRQYLSWHRDERSGEMTQWPHFYTFDTCKNLVRTIPQMVHDGNVPEDLDSDSEDHAVDPWRYGLMSRPPLSLEPIELMEAEIAEAAMRAKRFEEKSRKQ